MTDKFQFTDEKKTASNILELAAIVRSLDDAAVRPYLERKDFSSWIRSSLKNEELADKIGAVRNREELLKALDNWLETAEKEERPGERQLKAVKSYCDGLLDKYAGVVKAMWLLAPDRVEKSDDLTIIILLNDVQQIDHVTRRKVETAAMEQAGLVKKETGISIRPSFYLLSDYWDLVRHGSPVTFCEMREGIPVYDPSGFFVPLKKLLLAGRIPGTKEAMRALISRSPARIKRIRLMFKARVLEQIENAVVDAGQAPLIAMGVSPPVPKQVASSLETHLVNKGLLEPEWPRYCDEVVKYWKKYEHGELKEVSGEKLDELLEKAVSYVKRMERLMEELG